MDIKGDLLLSFTDFLIESLKTVVLICMQIMGVLWTQLKNYTNQLLCVIDIFSKYAWVVPLKDRKGITITNAFQKILKESDRKPNKIWVDKGSEFYNSSIKKWLKDNNTKMSSIHNEGKSVVAEIFIRTLKTKIFFFF